MKLLDNLIENFSRLPGIGKKSASRIVYWLLETNKSYINSFADNLKIIQDRIIRCEQCGNYSESRICDICNSSIRDNTIICVVEHARDLTAIETTGEFKGLYHVLHGVLSPLDGMGPKEIGLDKLHSRVNLLGIAEIIVATNPTLEGDSTAMYIVKMFSNQNIKVTRIATGLPVGGDMEYADKLSITRSFRARQNIQIAQTKND